MCASGTEAMTTSLVTQDDAAFSPLALFVVDADQNARGSVKSALIWRFTPDIRMLSADPAKSGLEVLERLATALRRSTFGLLKAGHPRRVVLTACAGGAQPVGESVSATIRVYARCRGTLATRVFCSPRSMSWMCC